MTTPDSQNDLLSLRVRRVIYVVGFIVQAVAIIVAVDVPRYGEALLSVAILAQAVSTGTALTHMKRD